VIRLSSACLARAAFTIVAAAALAATAAAADAPDAEARARDGDAKALVGALAPGYRARTLDAWTARLYQDLRLESGERAALVVETLATFPEPRSAVAAYLVARVSEAKDLDAALQRLLPTASDPAPLLLDQGWAALLCDRLPAATALLGKIRRICPDREEAAILEARVLEATGDRSQAERTLAIHVAQHPGAVEARRAWADVLLASRRQADAVAVLDEERRRAGPCEPLVERAAVALHLRDVDGARRYLEEVKDLGRPALRADAHALRAAVRLAVRDLTGAEAAADEGLKACPESVSALRAKARCLELSGKTKEALRRLDAGLVLRPGHPQLLLDKGAVLLRSGRGKDGRKALLEARKRDPDLLDAAFLLGMLEEEEGDWAAAERAYRAVLKIDPNHVGGHRMLGGVLYMTSKLNQADAEASWVLERDPKDAPSLFVRGRVALRQGRFDAALEAFEGAVAGDPGYALGHTGRGWVLEEQERWEDAKKAYEAAVAADPRLPLPRRELGELLDDQMDDPVGALDQLKKYLELGGSDPDEDVWHRVQRLSK